MHVIERGAIELAAEAQLVPVGQVAAVSQVEAQNRVAGLQHGHVRRSVGLRAGVRLHIGMLGAKDLFGTVARQVLHHVGVFAAAVVAASRVALGIFVGENGAGRLQHSLRDEILAGNHLQPFVLAEGFMVNGSSNFGVGLGKGKRHAVSHNSILSQIRKARRGTVLRKNREGARKSNSTC